MKNFFKIGMFAFGLAFSTAAMAQDGLKEDIKDVGKDIKHGAVEAGKGVKKGAKKVAHNTAEVASKGKAAVTDQVHKDKVGPDGQTIYIDNHADYYWVDEKGHRHYIAESKLKAKVKVDD